MRFTLQSIIASVALAFASGATLAQTVGTTIPVGTGPRAIAINPIANKIYVANEGSDNVTVINGATHTTTNLAVGDRPYWLAANPETGLVYVVNFGASNVQTIDAANTVSAPQLSGGGGWTAVNPVTNRAYMLRYGTGDEFNTFIGGVYELTSATRSYEPVSIAVNQVTNIVYIVHKTTGDVTAQDVSVDQPYPPLLCPNGTGGIKPNPAPTDPAPGPCINIPDTAIAVAVNPVTNKIYSVSSSPTGQISVINGFGQPNPHAITPVTVGALGSAPVAVTVAVNPVSNKVYALFSTHVVILDGATNATTVIPATGPVAVGINASTNKVYVPQSNGSMLVINGATNAVSSVSIPSGAISIAVNPLTNTMYVLTASGVVPVDGAATDTAQALPLTTPITPFAGNTNGPSGTLTLTANNTYPSAAGAGSLANTRRMYYQVDTTDGPWLRAEGTGPFSASFTGLSAGSHTIYAFATNGLEAPSGNTDVNISPIVGRVASYTFNVVVDAPPAVATDLAGDGSSDLLWRNTITGQVYRFDMNGTAIASSTQVYQETNLAWKIVGDADFNGDGIVDLLWRNSTTGQVYVMPFNASGVPTAGAIVYTEPNSAWKIVATPDLNADNKADILWHNQTTGQVYGVIMNGTAVAGQGFIYTEPDTQWQIVAVGDLGTGTTNQLVWYNAGTGRVYLMTVSYNSGVFSQSGSFIYHEPNLQWSIVGVTDLDGSGTSDIVWRNAATGQVWGMLTSGGAISSQGPIHTEPSAAWKIVSMGDYDGNGKGDLLWRNDADGRVHVMLMNGLAIASQATVYTEPSAQWRLMGPYEYEIQ